MSCPPSASGELDRQAATLKKYPSLALEIRTHTDSRGNANRALSHHRAEAVVEYLLKRGIARNRLRASGYVESQPLNECQDGVLCTEAEYRKNRRADFRVTRVQ